MFWWPVLFVVPFYLFWGAVQLAFRAIFPATTA